MNNRDSFDQDRVGCSYFWTSDGGSFVIAAIAALSFLLLSAPAPAQEFATTPLVELHYTAGPGQVYELQGSNDLGSWRRVGDVVFGEGAAVSDFVSPSDEPGSYRFYRVKPSPSKEFGFAPSTLYGMRLELNDEGDALGYLFTSRAGGSAKEESIAYNYRKLGDTLGRIDVEYGDGESEHIELEFSADYVGRYTRTSRWGGADVDVDLGTFSIAREALRLRDQEAALSAPSSLAGNSYVFGDGDNFERFDFVTPNSGRAVDGVKVTQFDYSYSVSNDSATASVTLAFPGDLAIKFDMEFGNRSCGRFQRRELVDGELDHHSEGGFSSANSVYHTLGAEATDVTLPAGELTGRSYVMRDGGTPCILQFRTLEHGRCLQGNLVNEIRYDYVVNCNATSTVTVYFRPGEYDRYHLNHSDRTFMRKEVRGAVPTDTDTGTFTETP